MQLLGTYILGLLTTTMVRVVQARDMLRDTCNLWTGLHGRQDTLGSCVGGFDNMVSADPREEAGRRIEDVRALGGMCTGPLVDHTW